MPAPDARPAVETRENWMEANRYINMECVLIGARMFDQSQILSMI
jgi:hypothetical protein